MHLNVQRVVRHPKTPHFVDLLPRSDPWNDVACCTGLWVVLDWKPHQPALPRTRIDGMSAWALTLLTLEGLRVQLSNVVEAANLHTSEV